MAVRSAILNVMVAAAEKASRPIKRDFGEIENLQVSQKGPSDFVTAADVRTEKILHYELSKARPDFGFYMEESGESTGEDPDRRWIIDPIDGTINFIHGVPHVAISIALEEHGEITAALVYNPILEETFLAEKGNGASFNNRRIRVSSRTALSDCVIATGIPHRGRGDHAAYLPQLAAMMEASSGIRRLGSAALDLAYVAAGRFDGFWETGLQYWDVAAGLLLVREAGGFVTSVDGKDKDVDGASVLAANPTLHRTLSQVLTSASS